MNRRIHWMAVIVIACCCVFADRRPLFAVPPLPSSYYGTVTQDDTPADAGVTVSAWISGTRFAQTTTFRVGGDTVYALNVPGDDPSTPTTVEGGRTGEIVNFQVGGQPVDTHATWHEGSNVALNLAPNTVTASRDVWIPLDLAGPIGAQVALPISVTAGVGEQDILAYQFRLTFDPAVLEPLSVSTADSLSAGWTVVENHSTPGQWQIAAYGAQPLAGSGRLLALTFLVTDSVTEPLTEPLTETASTTTDLLLHEFVFNEGSPAAVVQPGRFTAQALTLAGNIFYGATTTPVAGVTLGVSGRAGASTQTDAAGRYQAPVAALGDYWVTPWKEGAPALAISALDAAHIAQCVAALIPLATCPLANSDVSGDGQVMAYDAALIARYLAGLNDPSTSVGQWLFAPAARAYTPITSSQTGQDFAAYLVGDVTGNWLSLTDDATAEAGRTDSRTDSERRGIALATPTLEATSGARIAVPLVLTSASTGVLAFQVALAYDPAILAFGGVQAGNQASNLQIIANAAAPGDLQLVGYATAALDAREPLLHLIFHVVGHPGAVSPLSIVTIRLNEEPPAAPDGAGQVLVKGAHTTFIPRIDD